MSAQRPEGADEVSGCLPCNINPRPVAQRALDKMPPHVLEHFPLIWRWKVLAGAVQLDPLVFAMLMIQHYIRLSIDECHKDRRNLDPVQLGVVILFADTSRMQVLR